MTQQAKNVRSSSSDKAISVQVNPSSPPPFSSFPPIISPQPRVRLPFLLALHSSGENLARKPSEPLPITHITSQSLLDTALFRNISIFTSAQNWLSLKKLLEQRNIFDLHEPTFSQTDFAKLFSLTSVLLMVFKAVVLVQNSDLFQDRNKDWYVLIYAVTKSQVDPGISLNVWFWANL